MKKNAIITIFDEKNYGNRFQNYAVIRCFNKWGHSAVTLVKKQPASTNKKIKNFIKKIFVTVFKEYSTKHFSGLVKQFNFKKFTKLHIPTVYCEELFSKKHIESFDRFVVGSDQVWNPCFGNYEQYYNQMFLIGVPDEKKACFAPSFGVSEIPDEWKQKFADGLKTFPKLCSRESDGIKIIDNLANRSADFMIDPTLMLDSKEWLEVSKKVKKLPNSYVLDYFLGNTPNCQAYHDVLSDQYSNTRIRLLDPQNPDIFVSGPAEFIYLVSKSSLVCTDSFHACVFAILFGKPFAVFKREGAEKDMFSRLQTLLELFGIDTRSVASGDVIYIDPALRDAVLSEKRKAVFDFFNN